MNFDDETHIVLHCCLWLQNFLLSCHLQKKC